MGLITIPLHGVKPKASAGSLDSDDIGSNGHPGDGDDGSNDHVEWSPDEDTDDEDPKNFAGMQLDGWTLL